MSAAPTDLLDAASRLLEKLDRGADEKLDRATLDKSFDALIEAYAALEEPEREILRSLYRQCASWGSWEFWYQNQSYNLRFREAADPQDLFRALAHYSLCDGYPDPRDMVLAVGALREHAEQHGVDADAICARASAMSSKVDRSIGSVADLLR